jgi:EmrB/QacA subfamily drug resistance transporter
MPFKFSKDKWLILAAMICGLSMVFLDSSILPVALPTIQKYLKISDINLQWIVNLYFLGNAGFVILGGKLADIYGPKKTFMAGLIIFAVSSIFGGIAINSAWLFVSRALQGFGAALLAPSTTAIIFATFGSDQRGKALGISVSISSLFLILGPAIGGFFTQYLSWRLIFFINIFISLIGVFLTLKFVPNFTGSKAKIDYISLIFFAGGLILITLGVMQNKKLGWDSFQELGFFSLGITFMILFYINYKVQKNKEPFFDFSLFKSVDFLVGNIHAFIIQFILMNSVFWAVFFQEGMGFSPSKAGILTLISTLPVLITAPLAGFLTDKYGRKLPTFIGFSGLMIAFSCLLVFLNTNNFLLLTAALIFYGLSVSQVLTPIAGFIMGSAPVEKRGLASGIYNTLRFSGATMGMAFFGAVYTGEEQNVLKTYIETHFKKINKKQQEEINLIFNGIKNSSKEGLKVIEIKEQARIAAFNGIKKLSFISLVLLIIGFTLIFLEKGKKTAV